MQLFIGVVHRVRRWLGREWASGKLHSLAQAHGAALPGIMNETAPKSVLLIPERFRDCFRHVALTCLSGWMAVTLNASTEDAVIGSFAAVIEAIVWESTKDHVSLNSLTCSL